MTKKFSLEQFIIDCINKEFECVGSSIKFPGAKEFGDWARKERNKDFYSKYAFKTQDQYDNFKNYFLTHPYWKTIKMYPRQREREFSWFMLMYGFEHHFEKE